jgi:hypothetical protein
LTGTPISIAETNLHTGLPWAASTKEKKKEKKGKKGKKWKKKKKTTLHYTTYIICENVENNKPMKMGRMGIECDFE